MGTFIGHAIPGTFLFIFGTWWTFAVWRNYIRSKQNKQRYVCRCSYAVPCLPRKFSIEGIFKIVACSFGIASEARAMSGLGGPDDVAITQHKSMYAFYLLNGIVDVLYNAGFPLPPHTDYVALLLAVTSEGLLFHFHVHGRAHLDVMVHTLLVYTIAAVVVCIIAEMCRPRSVLASLGRAYFCLLQATWMWQVAFILYDPVPGHEPWDVHSHMDMMLAASVFAWHMMGVLVYVGVLGAVAWAVNRVFGRFCHDVVSGDVEEVDDLREAIVKRDM
uniref:Dermal papilla derived protein n=1 Tax=Rhipicephalus appendiculatus TaxID=34631 RepID=A0A131Z0G3_RHIAP